MKRRILGTSLSLAGLLATGVVVAAPAHADEAPIAIMTGDAPAPTSAEAALDVDVPSPDVLLAKNAAVAAIMPEVDAMLLDGLTLPAPDESQVPTTDGDGGGGTPALKLNVVGAYQTTTYRCVPASAQTVLQTMGVTVSQDTLAREMYTSTTGTYMGNAPKPMNRRQTRNTFVFGTDTASADELMGRTVYDVRSLKSALIVGVNGAYAQWRQAHPVGGLHAVAPYGYWTTDGGGIFLWDPFNDSKFGKSYNDGGKQRSTLDWMWLANLHDSAKIVW